jgi:hypothetical protein
VTIIATCSPRKAPLDEIRPAVETVGTPLEVKKFVRRENRSVIGGGTTPNRFSSEFVIQSPLQITSVRIAV